MALTDILRNHRFVILGGSGGVGKTTLSAALALRMAELERRVLVLTIDPARRLADALGVSLEGNNEREITAQVLKEEGISLPGSLRAMMLDMKNTFDSMVKKASPSPEIRDRILANRYYQHLSTSVSGSQDYMAVEKLYELEGRKDLDLVVLDTPPTRSALEFLSAPSRVVNVLEGGIIKMAVRPYLSLGRKAFRVLGKQGEILAVAAERLVGAEILREIAELALDFEGILEIFKTQAEKVQALLRDPQTIFFIVTRPRSDILAEAKTYRDRLREAGIPFGGFLVNRIAYHYSGPDQQFSGWEADLPGGIREKLLQNASEFQARRRTEEETVARLLKKGEDPIFLIPELEEPVHSLKGLVQLARALS